MYVEEDLVFYNHLFENQNELFDFMADALEKKKYVTTHFREAIKAREKEFPTGLQLPKMNVAIVHTDVDYSIAEKLVIITLEKPLTFQNIETLQPLEVEFIIGLILQDSEKHLAVLQKISELLQSEHIIQEIHAIKSQAALTKLMQNYFNEGEKGL